MLVNILVNAVQVNIYEAKTRLSELVDQASRGETVIIAKAGTPLAKLVPLSSGPKRKLVFGLMKGKISIADDFDAPLPDDVLAAFEGALKPTIEPTINAPVKRR
ncbi:MAG: type II toxin-antitoxin system Phd/YefM family antitoxin [Rhizobacter sp.]|nr:type II toxin-antitoxin system Phd/YefM family antitoxin [Rhizobacter sp.]